MLDKLNRSKNLLLLFFLLSCKTTTAPEVFYHTELNCPDRGIILIRYASQQDVTSAIQYFYDKKKAARSNENYTVISLPGNRSFKIDKVPVEEVMQCKMRQIPAPKPTDKYLRNLYTPTYNPLGW